jgi:TRAP transporter TAXI family solute receptor
MGTVLYAVGSGLTPVLNASLPFEVRPVPTSGPGEWLPMMSSQEMDLGILNVWDAQEAWRGGLEYRELSGGKGFPITLIASGHRALAGIIVAEDSGIKTGSDLRGKRVVAAYSGSPGLTAEAHALLANAGLTPQDIHAVTQPTLSAGVRAVIEGLVDANAATNVGGGFIAELEAARGARFIPCDPSPQAVERMQRIFPSTVVKVSPAPDKTGVRDEMYLMSYDFYLVGHNELPQELVYTLVKTMWDKNESIKRVNMPLSGWARENFVNTQSRIPYHPGAIRFYKEQGVWTEQMELRRKELEASKPSP